MTYADVEDEIANDKADDVTYNMDVIDKLHQPRKLSNYKTNLLSKYKYLPNMNNINARISTNGGIVTLAISIQTYYAN